MKSMLNYLWIQKKSQEDVTVLIKNGMRFSEGSEVYPEEYNIFYSLLQKTKRVYDKEGLTIGCSSAGVVISGNFIEQDEADRKMAYSFYSSEKNSNSVDFLDNISKQQGYSIPKNDLLIAKQVIEKWMRKKVKTREIGIAVAVSALLVVLYYFIK